DAIILTHHHEDHIGLVNRIRAVKDMPLYAHEKGIPRLKREPTFLEKRIALFNEIFIEMGCGKEADREVARLEKARIDNASQTILGDIIPVRGGMKLLGSGTLEPPAHTYDHILLYHEASHTAFVGDQLIAHASPNALIDVAETGGRTLSLVPYEAPLRVLL